MNSNQSKVSDMACEECGQVLPRADMVLIHRSWVCAACKPLFLQKLVEGAPIAGLGTTIWRRIVKPGSVPWVTVLLIGAVFVIYGFYALVESGRNPQVLGIALGLVSVAGGIGLMMNRRWSRYCIWTVSIAITGTWVYYVTLLAARAWPYDTVLETVISFVPGVTMILVLATSSYLVKKHFSAKPTPLITVKLLWVMIAFSTVIYLLPFWTGN